MWVTERLRVLRKPRLSEDQRPLEAASTLDSCVALWRGKAPRLQPSLAWGETLSMERGGTGRVLAARRGHSQLRGRRLLWKWFLPPAVSTSSLQWRTELFPLSACSCPAPAVLHPLLRWFGDGSRGGLRSLAPLEGLGWEKLPHSTPGLHTPTQSHA